MENFFDDRALSALCLNDKEFFPMLKKRKGKVLEVYNTNRWVRRKDGEKMPGLNVLLKGIHSHIHVNQKFPICKRLFAQKCEKNFFYHQVSIRNFPNVRELWIGSHPCEGKVFYEGFPKIFITEEYAHYAKRWAPKDCDYTVVTQEEFDKVVASFGRTQAE
ncbi:hypothetical protein MEL_383 [Melbournevirus]|uniref:hypothetical protein n=1 Tax=Melbournevirus TaxID=1560514 RepID=UPI00051F54D5|nr:hypothetical protein MEL_383 [Melbournevirus]AIT54996.1 hypothetical protein MEL_383 [Melbournevirus]